MYCLENVRFCKLWPDAQTLLKDGIDLVKGREEEGLNVRKPLLKLVEGSKGRPGVARGEAGGQHGRQPLHRGQNFPLLAFIVSPDGWEARGSAGAAVQPIEFVQLPVSVILRAFL